MKKIKIFMLVGNLEKDSGGAQKVLYSLCSNLNKERFEIIVCHMFGRGSFAPDFESQGIRVINIKAKSNFDLSGFFKLCSLLKKNRPDIIHTNSPISGIWGRLAGRIIGISKIVSVEQNQHDAYPLKSRLPNGLTLWLAHSIVGVSNSVIKSIGLWERVLIPKERICLIYNSIDIQSVESKLNQKNDVNQMNLPDDNIIGNLASMVPQKGQKYLIQALKIVVEKYPNIKLIFIGDGPLEAELRKLVDSIGLNNNVAFIGRVENVFPYLSKMDLLAFPSINEGLPIAILEAMVAKVPIVATDIGPIKEAIGNAGILVPPRDHISLAKSIIELINNKRRAEKLADAARKRVEEKYSILMMTKKYQRLYENLLAG